MRLDHIAYRVKDRVKTSEFFQKAFGYKIQEEFDIKFDDGSMAKCIAMEPPEKTVDGFSSTMKFNPFVSKLDTLSNLCKELEYHMAPEIFISDGDPNSIIGKWVAERGGIGGVHHIAYQVESVEDAMAHWKTMGYAEFSTNEPLRCEGITQVFSKPSLLTGVVYEFISRGSRGFCKENVKALMESSVKK